MTSTTEPSQPRLKVVPPIAPEQKQPQEKPAETPAKKAPFPTRWAVLGIAGLGLGGIAMMPVGHSIAGKTVIASTVGARQSVTMPETGRLTLHVRSNQTVKPGDILATVSSSNLEDKKAEARRQISTAKTAVNEARQRSFLAQSRLEVAKMSEESARSQVERKEAELRRTRESDVARIRAIEHENAGIESEIIGIENEISGLENERTALELEIVGIETKIDGLKKELAIVEPKLKKLEELVDQGGIGDNFREFTDLQLKATDLRNQIEQQENLIAVYQQKINRQDHQILKTRQSIEQRQRQIAAKSEGANEAIENLQGELRDAQTALEQKTVERLSAQQEVEAVSAEIEDREYLLSQREAELERLEGQEETLTVTSTVAGTVTTPNLDLADNQTLEAGREVLQVVNLSTLTGLVNVRQEDIDLIEPDLPVTFKPRQATVRQYRAAVEDIKPVVGPDESGQNSVLQIEIAIDNDDRRLQPGLEGVAHIQTPPMRVYQKVSREFLKLFPWWKI